jgi:hypothetical protein
MRPEAAGWVGGQVVQPGQRQPVQLIWRYVGAQRVKQVEGRFHLGKLLFELLAGQTPGRKKQEKYRMC